MLKYIDLFAGIGGFKYGMDAAGFECVFSAENDQHACEVYEANHSINPYCDITKLDPKELPDFDVLCGGFPCQSFSISGRQKGFYDQTRGTLFFDILRILDIKRPRAFFLENVKNLTVHDKGRTLTVMMESLTKLGYTVNYKVLNAKDFGVPQNRERIVLIGNLEGKFFDFNELENNPVHSMTDFLDQEGNFEYLPKDAYTLIDDEYIKRQKSDLVFVGHRNKKIRISGVKQGTEHLSRVHKQPNRIYSTEGVNPTFSAQEASGRYFIYDGAEVRKLTLDECFRFMGFPEDFKKIGSTSSLYTRIGNSICVNMVKAVAKELEKVLTEEIDMDNPRQILEGLYIEATDIELGTAYLLDQEKSDWVNDIVKFEETQKGVYTALLSSLVYKYIHPKQDVRYHKVSLSGGYSGRSFDTKYITPFLKEKRFAAAMKESGWLTRSIEQDHPFELNFPGKIQKKEVKNAFLNILNDIEVFGGDVKTYIINILARSISERDNRSVVLINPISQESDLSIKEIMKMLEEHFYQKYTSRGASILPVVAIHSIYECLVREVGRYKEKELSPLGSHYSSDRSSKDEGDVIVRNSDGLTYEAVEVKFDIPVNTTMILDAYEKIKKSSLQRYYILSTFDPSPEEKESFEVIVKQIEEEHGCQMIVNGLMKTLTYYLRLLEDTNIFINTYLEELSNHPEINKEHLVSWNYIMSQREKISTLSK